LSHAVCGGPSEARPGFETILTLSSTAIAEILAKRINRNAAALIGTLVGTRTFDLSSFCTNDPPPDPGIGPADLLALAQPQFLSTWLPAATKFDQWWSHIYWYVACQCTGGVTPTPPPPSDPGPAGRDTGLPSGQVLPLCWDGTATDSGFLVNTSGGPLPSSFLVMNAALPGTATQAITPGLVGTIPTDVALLLPEGVIENITVRFSGTSPNNSEPDLIFAFYNAAGTIVASRRFGSSFPGGPFDQSFVWGVPPTGATCWYPFMSRGSTVNGQAYSCTLEVSYTCGGVNTPVVPCCPPDPTVEIKLNQILDILLNLHTSPPGSIIDQWQDGARHSNLSGAGHTALARTAVGVRVEVNSIPPGIDVHPGDPAFYFDMGFLTPLAEGSPLRGQRIVFNPQSFELSPFADSVAWTLPAGVVIDLVELLPLP
jgi:hypothetical protein